MLLPTDYSHGLILLEYLWFCNWNLSKSKLMESNKL